MLELPHAPGSPALAAASPDVAALLSEELEQIGAIFERQLASDLSAVNTLCLHIEAYRGKMLRPTLVLLSGLAAGGSTVGDIRNRSALTDRHRIAAAVVEMIHMATLVHDDVLDEAEVRRRGATVNHLWGNEAAVMLGDYLISNAFHLCSTLRDPAINLRLGEVTNTLCEGELIQLHHRNDYGIDEAMYLEIVRRKTASLIGACCQLGATLSGANETIAAAMERFGSALGIAFQIQDDLLDLVGEQDVVGKSLGKDLAKGKITLPVTHLMASASQFERGQALRLIERHDVPGLRAMLLGSGSVEYSRRVARGFVDEANAEIDQLPDGPAKAVLRVLSETVVARSH